MSDPSVYIETTVSGHIVGRQQSDTIVAARQLSSRRWWEIRERYRIVSQIVIDECSAGDTFAAGERLQLIDGIQVLAVSANARNLAGQLMARHGIPESEPRDALHISIAAVKMDTILAGVEFRHIANADTRATIAQICRDCGYIPPSICSPDEFLGT